MSGLRVTTRAGAVRRTAGFGIAGARPGGPLTSVRSETTSVWRHLRDVNASWAARRDRRPRGLALGQVVDQAVGAVVLLAVRARSSSTAVAAAKTAPPTAMRAICQPAMPPVTMA